MAAFTQIAREIRSVYPIGFSPEDSASEEFRSLKVIVNNGDGRRLVAQTRAGYYAGRTSRDSE